MKTTATTMIGAAAAANILGIHVDTLRKRAKAGKVPGHLIKGKWMFDPADLVGGKKTVIPGITPPIRAKNVTDVVFVLDRSGSMQGLYETAKSNLDRYVAELVKASDSDNEYFVSIVNFDTDIDVSLRGASLAGLQASRHYKRPNGGTRLWDAMATAISICKDRDDGRRAFLVYTLTDGAENASYQNSAGQLAAKIAEVTASDRYTFAVAGPAGIRYSMNALSIPAGNVTEWEQSVAGLQHLGMTTNSAISSYATSRSTGQTYSTSFYANVSGPADKFAAKLEDKLDDVTSQVTVERVTASDPVVIKNFCEKKFGNFSKGSIYYQLTKSAGEKVQDYKKILIQDTTKGTFYQGWAAAKALLGIPNFTGTVKIKPGTLGEFKVFVQSTSINRKLSPGTAVIKF